MASLCKLPQYCCYSTRAPAKLNLRLKITSRKADGYHLLSMLNIPLDFSDLVTVKFEELGELRLEVADSSSLRLDDSIDYRENLAYKAAKLFLDRFPIEPLPRIILEKHIPWGAGLGGGSSDAAAVLRVLAHVWNQGCGLERAGIELAILAEMGLLLGADVPFFVYGVPALVKGIGEVLNPISIPEIDSYEALLLHPPVLCSTPEMFALYRERVPVIEELDDEFTAERAVELFSANGSINGLAACLHNDFEEIVGLLYPSIKELLKTLRALDDAAASLSGSGSTIMVLNSREREISKDFENAVIETAKRFQSSSRKVKFSQRGYEVISC